MTTRRGSRKDEARLSTLEYLGAVRPEADDVLQGLADDARSVFAADLCVVHLMLEDSLYFRAWSGPLPEPLVESRLIPAEMSMCPNVIEGEAPFVVEDLAASERFRDHFVCAVGGMRFYAGAPLVTSEGEVIGTVCLFGAEPRPFGGKDVATLSAFARAVAGRLELLGALGRERAAREEEARRARELERQKELYRVLLDAQSAAGEGLVVVDEAERIVHANEAFCRITGYELAELSSMPTLLGLLPPEDRASSSERLRLRLEGREFGDRREAVLVHKSGRRLVVEIGAKALRTDEGPRLVAILRDVTERKRSEEALEESERLLRAVTEGAPVITFALDAEGVFTFENGCALRTLGVEPNRNNVGRSVFEVYAGHPEIMGYVRRALSGEEVVATVELGGRSYHTTYAPQRGKDGGTEGVIGVATDITDRVRLEKELEHRALHDALTGLPNRDLLADRLGHALNRTGRRGDKVAVLFVDLDDFKIVNDSLGHEMGDGLLVEVARRIRSALRPEDTVSRMGGDEFVVLLEDVAGEAEATEVVGRVLRTLEPPVSLGDEEISVTASIGVALLGASEEGATPESLLANADAAMYRAKEGGKNRHAVFRPEMRGASSGRRKLEGDLRRALRDPGREFLLHYQPKVSLATGVIVGFEALVRWEHPEKGLVPPAEFVPLSEETGLIVPLGRWVLEEACRQANTWHELYPYDPPLTMSVNLSARQFRQADLVRTVSDTLGETGFDPRSLVLEITESAVMEDAQANAQTLRELKALGVRIAIDDFGTGYSSLAYLKRFPVDFLKIDRSFVDGLGHDRDDEGIVSSVVNLAHTLRLEAVAEGVESEGQRAHLRKIGCELAQGFYFRKPMPGGEASSFLSTSASSSSSSSQASLPRESRT